MPKLVILTGQSAGKEFKLSGTVIVGRSPDCGVRLSDDVISRHHATIVLDETGARIKDEKSANGTFLNGKLAEAPVFLKEADLVNFGNVTARFHAEVDASVSSEEPGLTVLRIETPSEEAAGTSIVGQLDAAKYNVAEQTREIKGSEALAKFRNQLRTITEIGKTMAETLELDKVLNKILDCLFEVFGQTEHGFVVLAEDSAGEVKPYAVKVRDGTKGAHTVTLSQTIVRLVMDMRKSVLSTNAPEDDRFKGRQSIVDMHIRSMMVTPLIFQERLLGFLQLDTSSMASPFDNESLQLLTSISHQVAMCIANAQMHEKLLAQQRLEQDLRFATRVQLSFLPKRFPSHSRWVFQARYTPAYQVGGDFYDFIERRGEEDAGTEPGQVDVIIGDVSGKGVSAALMMARLIGDIRAYAGQTTSAAKLMRSMNGLMDFTMEGRFVTLLIMRLDTETGRILYSNAGHSPPIVRRANGEIFYDEEFTDFPLGVMPAHEYDEKSVEIGPGDTVVVFTDGIIEAMNGAGKCYSVERLIEVVKSGPRGAKSLQDAILDDVNKHVGEAQQSDDLTLVCFDRLP